MKPEGNSSLPLPSMQWFAATLDIPQLAEASSVFTWAFPCVSAHCLPSVYICFRIQISPFYKDASHI